jgi:hypothetical protein
MSFQIGADFFGPLSSATYLYRSHTIAIGIASRIVHCRSLGVDGAGMKARARLAGFLYLAINAPARRAAVGLLASSLWRAAWSGLAHQPSPDTTRSA